MNLLEKKRGLSTLSLTLLMTGAIDSIRNLPTTALFGSSLIFFFILAAFLFLIPAALVAAELSSLQGNRSGIYQWVHAAFGDKLALLAVWLQWINTMVWFPTILVFIAGTATYLMNPALIQNKLYLITVVLGLFWTMTLVNLKGVHFSTRFANICSLVGMVIPLLFIILLAIIWIALNKPLQIHFSASQLFPFSFKSDNWVSLTAIMTSFVGIELAAVHIKDIDKPQSTFPRALGYSVFLILTTMIIGSLSIAVVLPKEQINLVNGVMQVFTRFFDVYHLHACIPLMTLMLLMGSLGGMISWIISPAKGLLQAAQSGFLPTFLTQQNRQGVPAHLLITQAMIVTIVCSLFLLMPSLNGAYWLLSALSTELYMLMYVLMFLSALCLRNTTTTSQSAFRIPGGNTGKSVICLLGLLGCLVTVIIGFIPPSGIDVGNTLHYKLIFMGGMIVMVLPVGILYLLKSIRKLHPVIALNP